MRIAVYSPYLDTFGGGERYLLTIAEVLSSDNQVDLLFDEHLSSLNPQKLKDNLSKRLNLNLSKVNLRLAPLGKGGSLKKRVPFLRQYDFLFFITDGSLFYSTAKKSVLHIQTPVINKGLQNFKNRIYLSSWDLIIYNSKFTKRNVEKYWPKKSIVVYPPVDTSLIKPLKKKKNILSVGRFFGFLKEKKHEVMIKVFIQLLSNNKLDGWSLNLVGSASEGDKSYIEDLKEKAKGHPINFYPNLSFKGLVELYGESQIYWHAMGYGESDPTKMEHFGITTVEAMAGGCVPVVINKGGQTEIVEDGKSGFLWNNLEQLQDSTLRLIEDESFFRNISESAVIKSKIFSKENFKQNITKIVNDY